MAASTMPRPKNSVWQSVLEAVKGTEQDFTKGSISRAVLLLATPMVLEMVMESLFAVVDIFWVTRLGANAVATVGLTESMLTIVFSVALGISLSTWPWWRAVLVKRRARSCHGGGSIDPAGCGCRTCDWRAGRCVLVTTAGADGRSR